MRETRRLTRDSRGGGDRGSFQLAADAAPGYLYPGSDIGAAAIKAEQIFNITGRLRSNPWLASMMSARERSDEPLPETGYIAVNNGTVRAFEMAGLLGDDSAFPAQFIGGTGSSDFGILDPADFPVCESANLLGPVDLLSELLDDVIAESTGRNAYDEEELADGSSNLIATRGYVVALLSSVANCGNWSPWFCTWTVSSNPTFGGYLCHYREVCTRTRFCRRTRWFCDIPYSWTSWTET